MTVAAIQASDQPLLRDTDTVADAARLMLDNRVTDLPVVDAAGKLVGVLKLQQLLEALLPKAVRMDFGMPDLAFVSDTLEQLRRRMREIEGAPVRRHMVEPEHVVHPQTSPLEVALLLYRGANAVPVVAEDSGQFVGMISARDILQAVRPAGAA